MNKEILFKHVEKAENKWLDSLKDIDTEFSRGIVSERTRFENAKAYAVISALDDVMEEYGITDEYIEWKEKK